jgi:hypothetical protein
MVLWFGRRIGRRKPPPVNQALTSFKQAGPITSGLGGVYVGVPWVVVVLLLLFFYGSPPAHKWIGVWRNARSAPGLPDRLTADQAIGLGAPGEVWETSIRRDGVRAA